MANPSTVTLVANTAQTVTVDNTRISHDGSYRYWITVVNTTASTTVYARADGLAATVKGDGCIAIPGPGSVTIPGSWNTATTSSVSVISSSTPDVSVQAGV